MNKKGFTLVELLAVVVIMAVIALIAVPNVVNMLERGKREQTITDAKEMIAKAKYKFKLDEANIGDGTVVWYDIKTLGFCGKTDGYGEKYNYTSGVGVNCEDGKCIYSVALFTENHCLGENNSCTYVTEENLDIDKVIDNPNPENYKDNNECN